MKTVTNIEIKDLVNRTPKEIVAFFKAKGYTFSWDWQDTWQECHTKAFTVAKVMEMDILTDIRKEVENAIENGITLEQFKQNLEPVLSKKGWWEKKIVKNDENGLEAEVELGSNRRMKTIYETNLTTSYRAGQYKQQWENREARPNWMYVCKMLPTSREEHKALNGKVFPADDPFWETFYPPNGWGCKCDVIPLTDEELQGLSTYKFEPKLDKDGNQIVVNGIPQYKRVKSPIQMCHTDKDSLQVNEETVISNGVPLKYKTTSYIDPKTKQVTTTDRGWNYNVGKATYTDRLDLSKYDDDFKEMYLKMEEEFAKKNTEFRTIAKQMRNPISKKMNNKKLADVYVPDSVKKEIENKLKNYKYNEKTTENGNKYYISEIREQQGSINKQEREKIEKEIKMAEILADNGHQVYMVAEDNAEGVKNYDAIIDGKSFDFKNVTGSLKKVGSNYHKALKQADNVYELIANNFSFKEIYSVLKGEFYKSDKKNSIVIIYTEATKELDYILFKKK